MRRVSWTPARPPPVILRSTSEAEVKLWFARERGRSLSLLRRSFGGQGKTKPNDEDSLSRPHHCGVLIGQGSRTTKKTAVFVRLGGEMMDLAFLVLGRGPKQDRTERVVSALVPMPENRRECSEYT